MSTFSQTPTESVSPGRMVSGETAPALTKPEPKPSVSSEREAAAIGGRDLDDVHVERRVVSAPRDLADGRAGARQGAAGERRHQEKRTREARRARSADPASIASLPLLAGFCGAI